MDPFASEDLFFAYALLQALVALLLIRFVDLYEREPLSIVALLFVWGAIGAAILASVGNEVLQSALPRDVEVVYGPAISAPVVEELAKGLALLAAFAVSRWAHRRFGVLEFEGVTDGIVYGAAVGIGFAFTEDLYYFFREAQATGDLGSALDVYLDRRDFFGPAMLRHAIWTATFGAALGLATWSRGRLGRIGLPLLGLALAMLMHAVNNGLVPILLSLEYGFETTYDYLAVGVPVDIATAMDASADSARETLHVISWVYVGLFFVGIALWLRHQRGVIAAELAEERESGVITSSELRLADRFLQRTARYVSLLRNGKLDQVRSESRLYGELADLAFAKRRLDRRGETTGDEIAVRREQVRRLSGARDQETSGIGQSPGRPPS